MRRSRALPWTLAAVVALVAGILTGAATTHLPRPGTLMIRVSHTSRPQPDKPATTPAPATPAPTPTPSPGTTTTTQTVDVGGMTRHYLLVRPTIPAATRLPAIAVLHGVNATPEYEEKRDGLLPLAVSGQVVLAYLVGYDESWNADACCNPAMAANVDDVGFIAAVLQQLGSDPGIDSSRITLMGYSNGGRMALAFDCARPGVVMSVVVILAVPVKPCQTTTPASLLQIATADDPEVPYTSGSGDESDLTPVTREVAAWRARDGCADTPSDQTNTGNLLSAVWSGCRWGTQVQLATYASGGHNWPIPSGGAASPMRLIWNVAIAGPGAPPQ